MKRNLIIEDMDEAQSFLKRVNYYRFSAYGLTLKQESNKDLFKHGVTFNRMKMIYNFDQKLRKPLMSYLEPIEIEFRTRISYYHAHEFGPLGYKKSDNFVSSEVHEGFLKKLNDQIDRSNKELFVMHHKSKYRGEFPFWVAIEVISFGELSKLFRNLHDMTKVKVVKDFNVPHYYVTSWLHILTYVRNVCAHYGRLYGKRLVIKPQIFKSKRNLMKNDGIFQAIFVLTKLLHTDDRKNFIISLQALLENYWEYIELKEIGFPVNWEKLLYEQ